MFLLFLLLLSHSLLLKLDSFLILMVFIDQLYSLQLRLFLSFVTNLAQKLIDLIVFLTSSGVPFSNLKWSFLVLIL
jgi:hypothetical protein